MNPTAVTREEAHREMARELRREMRTPKLPTKIFARLLKAAVLHEEIAKEYEQVPR